MISCIQKFRHLPARLLALTLGRLLLLPVIILSFDTVPAMTAAALTVFIAADLYDGIAARQLDADDVARRVLDTLVDRLSIWPVYIAVTFAGFLPVALLALFAARDSYCGYLCFRLVNARDVAIRADWMYRSLNLMLAGWIVLAPFASSDTRASLFVAILAYSALVAVNLRRSVRVVFRMPATVRSTVISATALRDAHVVSEKRPHRQVRSLAPMEHV